MDEINRNTGTINMNVIIHLLHNCGAFFFFFLLLLLESKYVYKTEGYKKVLSLKVDGSLYFPT
jgi:hypothetical protein